VTLRGTAGSKTTVLVVNVTGGAVKSAATASGGEFDVEIEAAAGETLHAYRDTQPLEKPWVVTVPASCELYVNDAATSGDRYTSAPGSDTNPGTAAAPFATLTHAVAQAKDGAVICVDAGAYAGYVVVDRSVSIHGVRQGVPACGRSGAESVIKGRVTMKASAAEVTLDGLRLEHIGNPSAWNGVNLVSEAQALRLLNTWVVPTAPAGGFSRFGYVFVGPATGVAALTSLAVRGNRFDTLLNTSSASGLVVANVKVSGAASITGNCFDDSGDDLSLLVYGAFNTLELDANVIANSATGGAGGIGVGSGSVKELTVANNRILDASGDGLAIDTSVEEGSVTGNVIRGSGASGAGFSNIHVTKNAALAAGFYVRENDLSAPSGSNLALHSEATAKLEASCNWYGVATAAGVAALISGNVGFTPFLTDGTDADPGAPGFQPASGSCTAAAAGLLFDRGLPDTNLNNASPNRSNVRWDPGPTEMTGDDFTLPAGKTFVVTTVRIWVTPGFDKKEPPTLGDWFKSVELRGGPAGSAIPVLSSSTWSAGTDQPDASDIVVKKVSYPQNPGSKYQNTVGDFYQLYQVEFRNLGWTVKGGTKHWFAVRGVSRQSSPAYPWMNHASNAANSGTPQDGADDVYLVFDAGGSLVESVDTSKNGDWDKTSNINVQIEGFEKP
jgi:hypothetical protein